MVRNTVIEIITREMRLSPNTLSLGTTLEEIGIDSMRAITILFDLEDHFNIDIPNEIIENIVTVGDIVSELERLLKHRNAECA